jgi:putative endonuclease
MKNLYYTYIITNRYNTVFYIGVTNNLEIRIDQHKRKLVSGFTSKYNVNKLVWYEMFSNPYDAIAAEKKIKGWKREKKIKLIKERNPEFNDLLKGDSSPEGSE